ncbi:MAG: hypothetical protein JXB08_03470 [Bacilli bacterium]|nr:hypothetical protein [Bacilli bacterium]MBN2877145.1 hypothetical protein [Bacilli bacterium]
MKKPISIRIAKRLLIFLLSVILFFLILNLPLFTVINNTTDTDYSNWMSETLSGNERIVDIAMLGAHDAFSYDIDIASPLDPYETNSIMQGATGVLVKGFIVRQSRTQMSTASELLKAGVRYFDIRLTYDDGNWYTKHNYISTDFLPILQEIIDFLDANTGEVLILDFQHISGLDYNSTDDYNVFHKMLFDSGILDYAPLNPDLSILTYGALTNAKTESKVVITSKFANSLWDILQYDTAVRSEWADSDNFEYVYDFLKAEAAAIQTGDFYNRFRIMQGVTTMQMTGGGIVKAIGSWSLINRAKAFNDYLISQPDFVDLLSELPIVMVDYADTNSRHFNEDIMQIIMDFNVNS